MRLLLALEKMEGTAAQKMELISKLKAAGLLLFEVPEDIKAALETCEVLERCADYSEEPRPTELGANSSSHHPK